MAMQSGQGAYRAQQPQQALQQQGSSQLADLISRGTAAETELYGGAAPTTPQAPNGMEIVDGVTGDIYESYGQLENYAHTMWDNYRINVTRPDRTNPEAVKANQIYMKMLAKIQYASDVLKQSNTLLGSAQKLQMEGKGSVGPDVGKDIFLNRSTEDQFVSNQLDPAIEEQNKYRAKVLDTASATKTSNAEIAANTKRLADHYRSIGQPQRAAIIEAQAQRATHDQPQFAPQRTTDSGSDAETTYPVFDQVKNIRNGLMRGDESAKAYLLGIHGITNVTPVRTGAKMGVRLTYKKNGEEFTEYISFKNEDSVYGGMDQLYEILASVQKSKFAVNPNDLIPYFKQEAMSGEKFNSVPLQQEFENVTRLFRDAHNLEEPTTVSTPDGEVTLTVEDKKAMVDKLISLANQGKLQAPAGGRVLGMKKIAEESNWFSPNKYVYLLDTENNTADAPIKIDPTNPEHAAFFESLLEVNFEHFLDPKKFKFNYEEDKKMGDRGKTGTTPNLKSTNTEAPNTPTGTTNTPAKEDKKFNLSIFKEEAEKLIELHKQQSK